MLQKQLITSSKNLATQNVKLSMAISSPREIWSNTALFELGLEKFDMTSALTKSEVQRQLPKYYLFHPPVL